MSVALPPDWFAAALCAPQTHHQLDVGACLLHYVTWGDPAKAPLVLVHGGLAHAMWWTPIAAQLASDYYVIAPDLAGHGDSGRRTAYSLEAWAADLMAVCAAATGGRAPYVVGHSLGGQITMVAAALNSARMAAAVIVDAPVAQPVPENAGTAARVRPLNVYPDLASAMARFRLLPDQPFENDFVFDYIARQSLRQLPGGWCWKFDPAILARTMPPSLSDCLASIQCRTALIRGEHSAVLSAEAARQMARLLDGKAPLVELASSWHHHIIDQPLALLAALRALLAAWDPAPTLPHTT